MFFVISIEESVRVEPKNFGPGLKKYLFDKVRREYEGRCTGKWGVIIAVTERDDMQSFSMGRIDENTGEAHFRVKFQAIVCKPFKGEVVDAVVSTVSRMGVFCQYGPLSVFVAASMIPSNYSFDNSTEPAFVTANGDEELSILKGAALRVLIIGTRVDTSEIFSIGSIADDFFGLIDA